MKGFWHFPALGVVSSAFTIIFHSNWFILLYFLWILLLFYHERLGKLTILISLTFSIFFYFYIPNLDTILQNDATAIKDKTNLVGQIASSINESASKIDFVLKEYPSNRKLLVIYFKNNQKKDHYLKYGSTCEVYGQIELPDKSRNPGQFDYQNYLLSKGITHQVVIGSLENINCTGSSTLNKIYTVRSNIIKHVASKLSPQTAKWLNALVLGDDTQISNDIIELFQRWNLSHLLAISGLHVGLIVALLYFLFIKFNILTKEKTQWVIIFFLPFYAFLAGGEPSVWRASSMVLFFIIISKTKIKFSFTDVLSIVFILLIALDKYIIYNIGFQLSFSVTMGLLLSKNWLSQPNISFFSIFKISFVSQMVILPLQLMYFSTFQPLSILLNVLVVPYFSAFVIPFLFLMLVVSLFAGVLIPYFDLLFYHIHGYFISLINIIDQVAYFPWVIGSFSLAETAIYYGIFLVFMNKMELMKLKQAFMYGCYLTFLIIIIAVKPYFSPVGSVTMLDIGQGDAMVIELPYRRGVVLIDAGAKISFKDNRATSNVYKQIIKPYLYSKGISRIDALFISHEDNDHMGSLPYILNGFRVNKVIVSNYFEFNKEVSHSLRTSDIQIERVEPNQEVTVGGEVFYVFSPQRDKQSTNENSLVLYTSLGGLSWLFTGDIGRETEKELTAIYPNLKVDVLKVAHHGSKTSTDKEFIEQIQPIYGLISVGVDNSYGHPHDEVISLIKERGITVFRTDMNGAIQYYFEEDDGTFFKYLP